MREKLEKLKKAINTLPAMFRVAGAPMIGPLLELLDSIVDALEAKK